MQTMHPKAYNLITHLANEFVKVNPIIMTIIPFNKVIGMTNYPKDDESSFKNEKIMGISFFEEIFDFTEIRQIYKGRGNFKGGAIFKMPPF